MSYFGGYGGGGGYGGYGGSYGGYGYYGGYSNYGMYDPTSSAAYYADASVDDIVVIGHRPNYSTPQYYIQYVNYTPVNYGGGGGGGGGDGQAEHDEKLSNAISKIDGGLKAIIPYLDGKPKALAEKVEAALDLIEKAELSSNVGEHLSDNDIKGLLSDVIGAGLDEMTAQEFGVTVAALVGAVGAETGPADLALLSLAGAGAFAAYETIPTSEIASTIAGAIVSTVEFAAAHS